MNSWINKIVFQVSQRANLEILYTAGINRKNEKVLMFLLDSPAALIIIDYDVFVLKADEGDEALISEMVIVVEKCMKQLFHGGAYLEYRIINI